MSERLAEISIPPVFAEAFKDDPQYQTDPDINPPREIQIVPGLGENSRLTGTGFNLLLEKTRFFHNYLQNLQEGKDSLAALMLSASELEVNIRTFVLEYIQAGTVLPHVNRIAAVNGVSRMVGDNGVPVVWGVTDAERNGSVLEASIKVDEFMSKAQAGTVAVINSPMGWSGLRGRDGTPIVYGNNQTMVYWINNTGQLEGLTLVTDLDQDQSQRLSLALGVAPESLTGTTEEERVANIVRHPALLSFPRSDLNPAEYVLEKILAIRGMSDIRLPQEEGVELRSVANTSRDVNRRKELLRFNQAGEQYLAELKKFILSQEGHLHHPSSQMAMIHQIENTILKITVDYLANNQLPTSVSTISDGYLGGGYLRVSTVNNKDDFYKAASFLRTRGGCHGGGRSHRRLRGSSLGTSIGRLDSIVKDQYGSLEFECPKCNRINRRSYGRLIPNCQHCGSAEVGC